MFPEGAGYEHDNLDRRSELSEAQKPIEPQNADSHLAFMAGALRTCVAYQNRPGEPVSFIDLDGVHDGRARRRLTSVIGYRVEEPVAHARVSVPVSGHAVDSVNLKNPQFGVYAQCAAMVAAHGVTKGRLRVSLAPGERHAGLTVNEYETLLMRHDLSEVLRDPLRFMAEKAGHMLGNPRAIPAKTLGDSLQTAVGAIEGTNPQATLSQGSGTAGGAGTGSGGGIGPGQGSGLGPGYGGGTGGGAYRPGNGVELPRVLREVRPNYTADAMRAKVQGTVWVEVSGFGRLGAGFGPVTGQVPIPTAAR